jgi:hypothetical protein
MTLCEPWITGADVAECCDVSDASDSSIFDNAAEVASEVLFELSARRFPGICTATVRPCRTGCGCAWQVLSRGYVIWNPMNIAPWWGWWACDDEPCGCRPLSRVLLAGKVRSIVEVLIDGDVVDADTYRVDQNRWLTRVRPTADDQELFWPGCQNMDLTDDQPGTWSVTYTYGTEVPVAGTAAARQLACEIYKACVGQECQLPKDTVRAIRAGVVQEKPSFISWGFEKGGRSIPRGWRTFMPLVDMFLNTYNSSGVQRVPLFWSPTRRLQYAPTLGLPTSGS